MSNKINALKAHISLNVKSVSESIKFYQKLFNIEPLKVRQGYAKFDVQNPPLNLALNQVATNRRGSLAHLGIQVGSTKDVLEIKKGWEESGLKTADEMQTNCCYALQDKTWVTDPDGNEWEVFVVLEDNLQNTEMSCVNDEAEMISTNKTEVSATECCASSAVRISSNQEVQKTCC